MTQHALDIQKLESKFEGNTKKQQDIVKNQEKKYNEELAKQNKEIEHLTSLLQKQQEEIKKCNKELEKHGSNLKRVEKKHGEDIDRVQRKCNDNTYKLSSMYTFTLSFTFIVIPCLCIIINVWMYF